MVYKNRSLLLTIALQYSVFCSTAVLHLLSGGVNGYAVPILQPSTTTNHLQIRTNSRGTERVGGYSRVKRRRQQRASSSNDDDTISQTPSNGEVEPDLFDYFDPLLSPHAYPKGIGATVVTNGSNNKIKSLVRYDDDEQENMERSNDVSAASPSLPSDDLGWGSSSSSSRSDFQKKSYQLKKPFGISLPGSDDGDSEDAVTNMKEVLSPSTSRAEGPNIDISNIFDPTLSPHLYTKGSVPDIIIGDKVTTFETNDNIGKSSNKETVIIGILLMDHGSRNAPSNERLHELAKVYQHQFASAATSTAPQQNVRVVVKAAHMEIALPSIEDGLSALLQENVQEIICHPYFLSPGRHVVEDIPQIVNAAIQALSISIPVRTTRPIGSETSIMINAINSLVTETSEYLQLKGIK